jgi:uncharacterized delta-60 repeat protein
MRVLHAASAALTLAAAVAHAANGDLDGGFGVGGIARTMISDGRLLGASGPVIDSEGRILICDRVDGGGATGTDMFVARFTPDGELDSSFSFDGKVAIDFDDGTGFDACDALVVQPDGRIVIVGATESDTTQADDVAVARLLSDGTLDTTFGGGDGKVIIGFDFGSSNSDTGTAVALDEDGRIAIGGTASVPGHSLDFAVARLLSDGSLDAEFNLTGKLNVSFDLPNTDSKADTLSALAIDGAGRIVLSGRAENTPEAASSHDFAVARVLPDGRLDPDFDVDGRATIAFDLGAGNDDQATAMHVMRDGSVVIAGGVDTSTVAGTTNFSVGVARLHPDGSLDANFGFGGRTLIAFDFVQNGTDAALGVDVQGNGRIVLAGYVQRNDAGTAIDAATVRLDADGTLDPSWGAFGKQTYALGLAAPGLQVMHGIAAHGGRIVVSGAVIVGDDDETDDFVAVIEDDLVFADRFDQPVRADAAAAGGQGAHSECCTPRPTYAAQSALGEACDRRRSFPPRIWRPASPAASGVESYSRPRRRRARPLRESANAEQAASLPSPIPGSG